MRQGNRFLRLSGAFAVGIGVLSACPIAGAQPPDGDLPPCLGLEGGPTRTVTRVIDGETVTLDDGVELRLVGALAPRAIDVGAEPGMWPMEVAAGEELRALLLGKTIAIGFGGERTDRHGRLQAHAFWQEGGRRLWVQGHMLVQGLARAYLLAGNRACGPELLSAERKAREAGRGLWREAAYQLRRGDRPAELGRYVATFQVIEGRIERVAQVRGMIYLNFDADWRRGFSVSVRRRDRGLLGGFSEQPRTLAGRRVRAHGWVEHRSGFLIDLSSAGLLEVVESGDDSGGSAALARPRSEPGGADPARPRMGPSIPALKTKPPGLVETGR